VDGKHLGALDRAKNEQTIEVPASDPPASRLDILVEGMGRINYGDRMIDRKGITDRVTLGRMTLMGWEVFPLPMDPTFLKTLVFTGSRFPDRPGAFFRAEFRLEATGDTYLDMSGWRKGVVWVNGRNLGRYWDAGPQRRLYCPAPFLKKGANEVVIFDMHLMTPAPVRGVRSLE